MDDSQLISTSSAPVPPASAPSSIAPEGSLPAATSTHGLAPTQPLSTFSPFASTSRSRSDWYRQSVQAGPKSWAEAVNTLASSKRSLQFEVPKVDQRTRVKGRSWQDPSRSKPDPILQVPTNSNAQQQLVEQERDKIIRVINRGFQKELDRTDVPYNVLNFEPKFGLTDEQVSMSTSTIRRGGLKYLEPKSAVDYDVINLGPRIGGGSPSNSFRREKLGRNTKMDESLKPAAARRREYNVLSGDYYTNNTERRKEREEKIRARVMEKFDATHIFHPILGTFFNAEKEAEQLKKDEERFERKRAAFHADAVTMSVQRSEGHAYNLLNGKEYHSERAKLFDDRANRRVPPIIQNHLRIDRYRDETDFLNQMAQERAMQLRGNVPRKKEMVSHGHDIVTNEPFGMTTNELKTPTESDRIANTLKGCKPPVTSMKCLRVETVGSRLTKSKPSDATPEIKVKTSELFATTMPTTSNERIFLLPKLRPTHDANAPQIAKASKPIVTSAADFVVSTGVAPLNPAPIPSSA